MKQKKHLLTIFLLAGLALLSSCSKEADSEGPMLNSLYGPLEIAKPLIADKDSVDFSKGENLTFTAEFSRVVDWRLKIEGTKSGAVKIFSGKSAALTKSNPVWQGEASDLPSFQQEKCKLSLYIPGSSDTLRDSVVIKGTKVPQGVIVTDFNYINGGWAVDYSADGCGIFSKTMAGAHANNYLDMSGTDKNGDTYIGSVGIPSKSMTPPAAHFPITDGDPNNVFFNVMLYGSGKTETLLTIQFREDEGILDGKFDPSNEDLYAYQVKVDWTGWKLLSINYSDPKLTFLTYGGAPGTNGNKIREPKNILQVDFILLAADAKASSAVGIDFPIFTEDKPYQP